MNHKRTKDVILLTGAGFTKNFGGYLAQEMWAQIFNDTRTQNNNSLKTALKDNFDFEAVFSNVVESNKYSDEERATFNRVVKDAYRNLDNVIKDWKFSRDSLYPVNISGLEDLLKKIWPSPYDKPSLFFTLNQDLFVERRWGYLSPCVPRFGQGFYDVYGQKLDESNFVTLSPECSVDDIGRALNTHNGTHYIKLHGSYGWKSSRGSNQLVIGTDKESSIKKEPILREYHNLFNRVIEEGGKKLLVIGYSFKDAHINKMILRGVEDYNLKIYIINTQSPQELKNFLKSNIQQLKGGGYVRSAPIWDGVSGYFPYSLKEVFPANQKITETFSQIISAIQIN